MTTQESRPIFVISLKFSPVMKTLSFGFGKPCSQFLNRDVHYLFSKHYAAFIPDFEKVPNLHFVSTSRNTLEMLRDILLYPFTGLVRMARLLKSRNPAVVYFVNPHPLNLPTIWLIRLLAPGSCILNHVHEPDPARTGNPATDLYYWIVRQFQHRIIGQSDFNIVSSQAARVLFLRMYPEKEESLHEVPLLYEDLRCTQELERKYLIFVGNLSTTSGFDTFIKFIKYSHGRANGIRFLILSKDNLGILRDSLTPEELSAVTLINRPHISDEMFCHHIRESFAVFLFRKKLTQSGIPAMAYMNGTALLTNLEDSVTPGRTGYYLEGIEPAPEAIEAAFKQVKASYPGLGISCREAFEARYYLNNWARHFEWLGSYRRDGDDAVPAPAGSAPRI